MSVILDSSFLVVLVNQLDRHHGRCTDVARNLREPFVIPVVVVPEVTYILAKRLGHPVMRAFVKQLSGPEWHIENLSGDDLERVSEVLTVYADAKLDFADATIVAMAERLGVETILTLDRRDFAVVRPRHTPYFNLLP